MLMIVNRDKFQASINKRKSKKQQVQLIESKESKAKDM